MQQAVDFLDESRALHALVADLDDATLARQTQFKQWSIDDVIGHLYFWNHAALLSLQSPDEFQSLFEPLAAHLGNGGGLKDYERQVQGDLKGQRLVRRWAEQFELTGAAFTTADPSARVAWAGPSMSTRSSISARQMETWAHGQEVFDILGVEREDTDRIRNIVVLGVNTFKWTFAVRGETPPEPAPAVVLTSPSGEQWTYGEPQPDNHVTGLAVDFARVVTQTRHVSDTALVVVGEPANRWMENAQCFAGAANPPPAAGSRYRVESA